MERGEKLGQLEERTEHMRNEAEQYAYNAHLLAMKYRDKKWYQFWSLMYSIVVYIYNNCWSIPILCIKKH